MKARTNVFTKTKMEQQALKKRFNSMAQKGRRHKQHFFVSSFLDKYDRYVAPNDRVVSVRHLPVRVSLVESLAR